MSFQRVPQPFALPGICFTCRKHEADFFIDTQLHVDYEDGQPFDGAVYICSDCLGLMGQLANFITPEQARKLESRATQAEDKLYAATVRQGKLEEAIGSLSRLVGSSDLSDGILSLLNDPDPNLESESTGTAGSDDSGPTEQDSEQGLGNLFAVDVTK